MLQSLILRSCCLLIIVHLSACTFVPIGRSVDTPATPQPAATETTQSTVAQSSRSAVHVVQRGETLSSIARRYVQNWRTLASINGINPPYSLSIGQVIRLSASTQPTRTTVRRSTSKQVARTYQQAPTSRATGTRSGSCSPPVSWQLPTTGAVRSSTSSSGRKGIAIAGRVGQQIRAAASGQVIYSGTGLQGYNNLIIIQHNEAFLSVYANNNQRYVREGSRVRGGQVIATMGIDNERRAALHFEIRCRGKAINPLPYLQAG